MINQPVRLDTRILPSRVRAAVYSLPHSPTTWVERFLLLVAMIILPLQDHIPTVAGMSVVFLIFAALAVYVALMRPRILGEVWSHPVFLAAYVFVGVSGLLEFSSPLPRYDEIVRFTQMIVGAICVAVLCRDRSALSTGLYGYIAAALWVSVVLFLTSYGTLQGMGKAENFHEASKIRNEAFADKAVQANINALGFVCVQGAIVAFALSLSDRLKHRRIPLLGIATFCLVASFLPMSRAAALISLVSLGAMLYAYGAKQGKALIVVSVLGMAMYMVVPDAVWSRMAFSTEVKEGKMEGRAWLLTTAINRLPEYIVAGVGSGNFWKKWGFEKGFYKESTGSVYGAHNALLQIAIYWGILGLATFLLIMWSVYRSIPFQCGRDELSLALLGIIVALGLWLLESHTFYDKWLAFGIGMLVGARERIWPTGVVSAVETDERTSFRTTFLGRHRI